MTLSLGSLSIALGTVITASQVFALARTETFIAAIRKFPRSVPWGVVLVLTATAWFLWYLSQESIADLASFKPMLYVLFGGVGIATCVFVQDFLAARGLALIFLLMGKLVVDAGRMHLEQTNWVLLLQTWAYVMVIAGMWLTVSPWRLRNMIEWATATPERFKLICGIRLAFGLLLVILGLTVFRNLG